MMHINISVAFHNVNYCSWVSAEPFTVNTAFPNTVVLAIWFNVPTIRLTLKAGTVKLVKYGFSKFFISEPEASFETQLHQTQIT